MERRDERTKKKSYWGWLVLLAVLSPEVGLPVAAVVGALWLIRKLLNTGLNTEESPAARRPDEEPRRLFCFHKDKGYHHVVRGREQDPWDRPDIDISKYQRNR